MAAAIYNAILLSGLPGSGKSVLARKLAEAYGWPVHSIGGLWRGEWKSIYKTEDEQKKNPFPEWWASQPLEAQIEMNRRAREIVARGNVIGDFRYSICCRGLPALFVFVTADLEVRVGRALNANIYAGKTSHEIKKKLAEREEEEVRIGRENMREFFKKVFGENFEGYDYRNIRNYDVVVDSGFLSVEQVAAFVKSKMVFVP